MQARSFFIPLFILCISCNENAAQTGERIAIPATNKTNPFATVNDIPLPEGYRRINKPPSSFAEWLAELPLKKDKQVHLYDGTLKANQSAQFAVLNISVGNENLQQCADAVMRLRSEYLYQNKRYAEISFMDNEGKKYLFEEPYTYAHLTSYLKTVFSMCGSASLAKQLQPSALSEMQPGDVIIRGGFPGHAVIVMDMAENDEGKKIFLLAQSYMPAQEIHILLNPTAEGISPWYAWKENEILYTPEYTFRPGELKRW